MVRTVGTVVRGIRLPIIKAGDDLVKLVVQNVLFRRKMKNTPLKTRTLLPSRNQQWQEPRKLRESG